MLLCDVHSEQKNINFDSFHYLGKKLGHKLIHYKGQLFSVNSFGLAVYASHSSLKRNFLDLVRVYTSMPGKVLRFTIFVHDKGSFAKSMQIGKIVFCCIRFIINFVFEQELVVNSL